MWYFNILELQKTIEEKRLILGEKIEKFLLAKLGLFGGFLLRIFTAKHAVFFCGTIIVAINALATSTRDIGFKSAANLDLLSVSNAIIFAAIFTKFLGILSLYLSWLALRKSELSGSRAVIFAVAAGIFLPAFTTQFNEFVTLEYLFLLCSFPLIAFFFKKIQHPYFSMAIAAAVVIATKVEITIWQKSVLYSLALPFLIHGFFLLVKNNYFNWRRDYLFFLAILLIPQFDAKNSFALAFDLCAFWPFLFLFRIKKWHINNFDFWFYFLTISAINFALFFNQKFADLAFVMAVIIFIFLLNFDWKKSAENKLSRLSASAVFLVLSYLISLQLAAIFNFSNSSVFRYKTPNYVTDQMAQIIEKYSASDEKIAIISSYNFTLYPLKNYLPRKMEMLEAESFDAKLIFVENEVGFSKKLCEISLLENYLRQENFRKVFRKNYVFLNRIIQKKSLKQEVKFFGDEQKEKTSQTIDLIERDIDVYIRK